jgi:hypothetical protein
MKAWVLACALVNLGIAACSSKSDSHGVTPAASPPSASAAQPAPSASAARPESPTIAWTGTYDSTPGTLFVRDAPEWKGVRFRGEDASTGLGGGPLSLLVDRATGRVTGEASGPLGDVVLDGMMSKETLTFSLLRKDAKDHGLTGTAVGVVGEGKASGTFQLSQADARVIRRGTFEIARKSP